VQKIYDEVFNIFSVDKVYAASEDTSLFKPNLSKELDILEAYLRIVNTVKVKDRTLNDQQTVLEGQRIISNKRNNPNLNPILVGIRARLEDEKK
jgi:hypothetical protein